MADINIENFYKHIARILSILYAAFPSKSPLYVDDVAGVDDPDEYGLHSPHYTAGFFAMLWLQLQYHLLTSLFGLSLKKETTTGLFGSTGWGALRPELTGLSLIGAIRKSPEGISLTRRGQYYWLVAMREFLTGVNNFRDQMRAHIKEVYEASYGESIPLVTVD